MQADDPVNELLALHAAGRFPDMESRARTLLKSFPGRAVLHELLGIALSAQERHAEALPQLERAARREPRDAQFWENLALCQRQLERFADAEASLRRSLALRPFSVETLNALGSVLNSLKRREEAEEVLRRALAINPHHAAAIFNLANTLRDLGRISEAEACYRCAIAINPLDPAPYANLGLLLRDVARFEEAYAAAKRVVELVGNRPAGNADSVGEVLDVAGSVFAGSGHYGEAVRIFKHTKGYEKSLSRALTAISVARGACDWEFAAALEQHVARTPPAAWARCDWSPFTLLMMARTTPADQLAAASGYARQFVAAPVAAPRADASATRRLRIGYLSGDLRDHAVAYLAVRALELHDRERFEVVAYDYSPPSKSDFRARLEQAFERVVPLHDMSNREAAQRIADDGCDIAVDLTGWTQRTRAPILGYRPAPVQAQWLGYPGTLGAPWIDYVFADSVLIRPGEEKHFSEKIVRLPSTYQPNDDRRAVGPARTRKDDGLPEDAFVFCSFNQAYKITPEVFDVWMNLLKAVECSVLWLLRQDPEVAEALRRRAIAQGVAAERLVFAPFVTNAEHLARIRNGDLALDCFPYGSHTTASDALWAGVPLIALAGDTFASRVSASILTAAGLPDLVTTSLEDYAALALRLATDVEEMRRIRSRIDACRRDAPLFDTAAFTRGLEAAYTAIWERHAAGLAPDHLDIR